MNIFYYISKGVTPDLYFPSLCDIDFSVLSEKGVKGIILDLDNTVLPWKDRKVPESSLRWVEKGKKLGIKFFILSNTVHTERLGEIASALDCGYIHPAFKPLAFNYRRAAEKLGIKPENMACVGDQLFTDIKGGNRAGFLTVLVDPLEEKEFRGTKISRFFEKKVKKYMDFSQ